MAKRPNHPNHPAMAPEWRPLAKIYPYPNNPRTHPQAQIELLAGIMKQRGVDQPIVVDEDGVIIKGHGRRIAAALAGFKEFPVVVHRGLSDADKKAMRIEDNQVSLLSGWDQGLMRTEISSLQTAGYDVALLGFPEATLRGWGAFGAASQAQDPEAIPDAPKRAIVRAGDLWQLGGHRLLCGDATKPESWKALFGADRAAMVFTDPPYGVSYEGGGFEIIKGDNKRRDELYKMLLQSMREMTKHAVDKAAFYIWHASSTREDFAQAMKAAGLSERQYLMWVKPAIVFGRADYQWQHEPCFYAAKADQSPAFYGERAESTVWHVQMVRGKDTAATIGNGILLLNGEGGALYIQSKAPKAKKMRELRLAKDDHVYLSGAETAGTVWEVARDTGYEHPTQKPVELARRAIENSSKPGEIVADGFLGSGTTLIGAEMTARRCFGTELDPVYAEVIIRRWETFTKQKAMLDGQTIEQVGRQRNATRHPRKPVPRRNAKGGDPKQAVRAKGDAGLASPGGESAGKPPVVAGHS